MTTILLVEDALDLAQAITRELQASGYGVIHTADGVSAHELAQRRSVTWITAWTLHRFSCGLPSESCSAYLAPGKSAGAM